MLRRREVESRKGVETLEFALVLPAIIALITGTVVLGLAVFRYNRITHLSREAARWASVRVGSTYLNATNQTLTGSDVLAYLKGPLKAELAGLDQQALSCTLEKVSTATTPPSEAVKVTLHYDWAPEGQVPGVSLLPKTFHISASLPVTY